MRQKQEQEEQKKLSIQEKIDNARKRKEEERQRLVEQRKNKRSASTQGHFFKPAAMNADLEDLNMSKMQHDNSETKVIKTGKQTSKPFFNRRLRNSSQNPPTDNNGEARESSRIGRGSVNVPKPTQSQAFNTIDKI